VAPAVRRRLGDLSPWIREILRTALRQDVIPFAASEPSPDLFPMEELEALTHAVFRDLGGDALRYAPTEGIQPLRELIAERLRRRGAQVSAANVIVTAGAQQALDLLARCFLEPGAEVAIESPTTSGPYRPSVAVRRGSSAPLTATASVSTRSTAPRPPKREVRLAIPNSQSHGPRAQRTAASTPARADWRTVPVIEDNVYGDTWIDGPPPPSLIERPGAEHVIHVGSLSKALFAGLRIGWIVAPAPVIERVALNKQIADLFSGGLAQWIALRIFESGLYDRHVATVRPVYRERRDLLAAALERESSGAIVPNRPAGASFLWCSLADGIGSRDLLSQASLQGVTFVPGDVFSVEGEEQCRLRVEQPAEQEGHRRSARRLATAIETLRQRRRSEPLQAPPPLV
jgi:2-aminoadipate transaminase